MDTRYTRPAKAKVSRQASLLHTPTLAVVRSTDRLTRLSFGNSRARPLEYPGCMARVWDYRARSP